MNHRKAVPGPGLVMLWQSTASPSVYAVACYTVAQPTLPSAGGPGWCLWQMGTPCPGLSPEVTQRRMHPAHPSSLPNLSMLDAQSTVPGSLLRVLGSQCCPLLSDLLCLTPAAEPWPSPSPQGQSIAPAGAPAGGGTGYPPEAGGVSGPALQCPPAGCRVLD